MLEDFINVNSMCIIGKPGCVNCERAKSKAVEENIPYVYIDVSSLDDGVEITEILKSRTSSNMFPFCFLDGIFHKSIESAIIEYRLNNPNSLEF